MNITSKSAFYIFISVLLIVAFAVGMIAVYFWEENNSDFDSESDFEMAGVLTYEGENYVVRDDVQTLLVIGIDTFSTDEDSLDSYNNDKCADFLALFVFDRAQKRYSVIHINRDTITEVNVLGVGGQKVGTVQEQIALSHTYGSGLEDSCRNTARAVSKIFGGMRIDRYVSLTMDAVAALNDAVGGVTLTVMDDMTEVDPALKKDATVTLKGDMALNYIRSRSALEDKTNASRMKRQQQYMNALADKFVAYSEANDSFSFSDLTDVAKCMVTDLSTNEIDRLIDEMPKLQKGSISALEGEFKVGKYMEFYPYDKSVKEILVKLFYKIKK